MKELTLKTEKAAAESVIVCGRGAFEKLPEILKGFSSGVIFTDENVYGLYQKDIDALSSPVFCMKAGEEHKTVQTLTDLLRFMAERGLKRTGCLVAVGGGVVGDIGGLAAALYMRGIKTIQVPTTLLAQVDSSVGGKTAVDFAGIKNLVGAFKQPDYVLADSRFFNTLPRREIRCGLGEIVKHGALSGELFDKLTKKGDNLFDLNILEELVFDNIALKAGIVAEDPEEKGLRRCLNLGHTTAHALELSQKTRSHGEYVLIGILFEAELSKLHCDCDEGYLNELCALSRRVLGEFTLPDLKEATRLALLDKKNEKQAEVVITVPVKKGQFGILKLPFETYQSEIVKIGRQLC